jgi:sensor c-di-GMP phosphodiesterase-like protein
MNKTLATLLLVVAGLMAVAVPVLLALHIAGRQGEDSERARVLGYAQDVLHRSDRAAEQIYVGIERLLRGNPVDPCAESQLAIMRELDLSSSYIQAMGHVVDDRMVCSSLSAQGGTAYPLGKPDVVTSTGSRVRNQVVFPFAPDRLFTVIERGGYAAIIHKDLPIDVSTDDGDLLVATVTPDNRQLRSVRGAVKVEWMDALPAGAAQTTFIREGYVVAVARSPRYATLAIAALPIQYMHARTRSVALVLVPTGIVTSALLSWAILFMVRSQLAMPAVLKAALRRREFFLLYQPIVDLRTREWVGAEALIRWRRASGELMRTDLFIEVAENAGLIQRVTEEVFRLLGRDAAKFFARHPQFHLGVNLAATDMHSAATIGLLEKLGRDTGAHAGNLCVEATERGLMDADIARDMVHKLRASGVRVALDDFGTGYSSLSYLETFELDYLKIDKSFVDKIGTEAATSQVVTHIIGMAKGLRLEMIAEGVETEAQAQFLREHGVQFAQGWLFGKPMEFRELEAGVLSPLRRPAPPTPAESLSGRYHRPP